MNANTLYLQEIKRVGQSSCVLTFFLFFNLTVAYNCHLFVIRHYTWQSSEIGSSYSQTLAMKIVHNTTLRIRNE